MISIIVSSYKPEMFRLFSDSVKQTIGVEYEIIKIDNPGKMGLCEAYNFGASKAKYPYLCFSHEDIVFRTKGWGLKLISTFEKDDKIGVVGIAGSFYKACIPSSWGIEDSSIISNYIQSDELASYHVVRNVSESGIAEVVAVDGCWFCTKREILTIHSFDSNTFKGFHCYDIDFCLSVGRDYRIVVTFDVLVEHSSVGGFNKDWLLETFKLHEKWSDLPRYLGSLSSDYILMQEKSAWDALLMIMRRSQIPRWTKVRFLFKVLYLTRGVFFELGLKNWIILQQYLLKRKK